MHQPNAATRLQSGHTTPGIWYSTPRRSVPFSQVAVSMRLREGPGVSGGGPAVARPFLRAPYFCPGNPSFEPCNEWRIGRRRGGVAGTLQPSSPWRRAADSRSTPRNRPRTTGGFGPPCSPTSAVGLDTPDVATVKEDVAVLVDQLAFIRNDPRLLDAKTRSPSPERATSSGPGLPLFHDRWWRGRRGPGGRVVGNHPSNNADRSGSA